MYRCPSIYRYSIRIIKLVVILTLVILPCDPVLGEEVPDDVYWDENYITEDLFRQHGSIMLIIDPASGQIYDANNAALSFYGYDYETITSMSIGSINLLSQEEIQKEMSTALEEERNYFRFKHQLKDGSIKDVEVYSYPIDIRERQMLYSIIIDITQAQTAETKYREATKIHYVFSTASISVLLLGILLLLILFRRKNEIQQRLIESEEGYENLFDNMQEGYALHEIILDSYGRAIDYRFLKVNHSFEIFTGLKATEIIGKTVLEILPDTEDYWIKNYGKVALEGHTINIENYSKDLDKYYSVNVYNAGYGKFITVFIDITDKKQQDAKINYLSYHDPLTDLYNRRYIEKHIDSIDSEANLPLSIIMADINGLKLTNDAFGHDKGDQLLIETANSFQSIFTDKEIIARVGGDEFIILLPKMPNEMAVAKSKAFKEAISKVIVDPILLSVSIGVATKNNPTEKFQTIYKRAEDRMYHSKLTESTNVHNAMTKHIFKTLTAEYKTIDDHQVRVALLAKEISDIFELSSDEKRKLVKSCRYHDVGFIAVPQKLCNHTETIDTNDLDEVRRHVECGFRILNATLEYSEAADILLSHHEWYNGNGYPRSLKENEIPKLSRILSILDAYDSMTHERVYKKVLTPREAVLELRRYSGIQFDPSLLQCFIDNYLSRIVGLEANLHPHEQ